MAEANTSTTDTNSQSGIMGRVRGRATAQLEHQKGKATDGIGSVAQAVRQSTQQLREQRHDTIAEYVDKAADQLDRFSTRLREKNVSELLDDVQRFARRQPAVFIGAAFAAGLLGARFLKSSRESARYGALQRHDTIGAGTPRYSGGGM